MNCLVTGAQFANKGAQSLLFSLVTEIRTKYPSTEIYYVPVDDISSYDVDRYKFKFVYDDSIKFDYTGFINRACIECQLMKRIIRSKRKGILPKVERLSHIWDKIDIVIDICGYNLSSKWPIEINNRFLRYIDSAKAHNLPIILMPQSFGPFNYNNFAIDEHIRLSLLNVDVICAREKQGVLDLNRVYNITSNVYYYPDLVLTSGKLKKELIYNFGCNLHERKLDTINNVGIIPNERLITDKNGDKVLSLYKMIIEKLTNKKKNVYIFRHSDDLKLCEAIYEQNKGPRVFLIKDEFDCFEYSEFIKQFDFLIASRFHSIVHAYKKKIPAIIVGWAEKYYELAELFSQDKYVLNIGNIQESKVTELINEMCLNYQEEIKIIEDKMISQQLPNCYEQLWHLVKDKEILCDES